MRAILLIQYATKRDTKTLNPTGGDDDRVAEQAGEVGQGRDRADAASDTPERRGPNPGRRKSVSRVAVLGETMIKQIAMLLLLVQGCAVPVLDGPPAPAEPYSYDSTILLGTNGECRVLWSDTTEVELHGETCVKGRWTYTCDVYPDRETTVEVWVSPAVLDGRVSGTVHSHVHLTGCDVAP